MSKSREAFGGGLRGFRHDERNHVQNSLQAFKAARLGTVGRIDPQGSYQMSVAQDEELILSQPTVSRVLGEVSLAIASKIAHRHIIFPSGDELRSVRAQFYRRYRLPGVVGCIDGTHIQIIAPNGAGYPEHVYVNRKQVHSINVQLVCDADCLITNVNAKFPGSTHDSFVWRMSSLRKYLEELYNARNFNSWLLGDSGYPLEPFLLTPYPENSVNPQEQNFNEVHRKARSVIERVNGQLKSRFRCLLRHRTLHYHPEKAANIIISCCVLHNMCVRGGLPDEELSVGVNDDVPHAPAPATTDSSLVQGRRIRDQVARELR